MPTCRSLVVSGASAAPSGSNSASAPWFNLGTVAAFLAWFGGTGYLLLQYYSVWFGIALVVSTLSGLGGASIVFLFLRRGRVGAVHLS